MSLLVLRLRRPSGAVALTVLCGLLSGASSARLIARLSNRFLHAADRLVRAS